MAVEFQLSATTVREVFNVEVLGEDSPRRWVREAALRERLPRPFLSAQCGHHKMADRTTRASSVIKNLNSRLRGSPSSNTIWDRTIWLYSNSSSTTAGSFAANSQNRSEKAPRNC